MKTKTFSVVTTLSMIVAFTAAALSMVGSTITGFYPGMIVLLFLALIPFALRLYAKQISGRSHTYRKNYYTTCTIINLLLVVVVLWMAFVIVHDRVLQDCC